MSEQELLQICESPVSNRGANWLSEAYGIGLVLRKFGYYPRNWALNINSPHGISLGNKPDANDLNTDAPIVLYFSSSKVSEYKRISPKKCYCVVSPNVFYRKSNKIIQHHKAQGTIAFLAHSTPFNNDRMNFTEYASQLLNLPKKFHPISVCLHYNDVRKGIHKEFQRAGLNVTTAGNPFNDSFIKNFYEILRTFRYSTSNGFGSYLFYSIEMNIPFFFYGPEPEVYDTRSKEKNRFYESKEYRTIRALFPGPTELITREQRIFVENDLGISESISRIKLAYILYYNLIKSKLGIKHY